MPTQRTESTGDILRGCAPCAGWHAGQRGHVTRGRTSNQSRRNRNQVVGLIVVLIALGPTATESARTSMHKLTQALLPPVPSKHAGAAREPVGLRTLPRRRWHRGPAGPVGARIGVSTLSPMTGRHAHETTLSEKAPTDRDHPRTHPGKPAAPAGVETRSRNDVLAAPGDHQLGPDLAVTYTSFDSPADITHHTRPTRAVVPTFCPQLRNIEGFPTVPNVTENP